MTGEEEVFYCAAETRAGSYYDPPEFCEEEVEVDGDLCYWHDPDGAEADRADSIAEARREAAWDD